MEPGTIRFPGEQRTSRAPAQTGQLAVWDRRARLGWEPARPKRLHGGDVEVSSSRARSADLAREPGERDSSVLAPGYAQARIGEGARNVDHLVPHGGAVTLAPVAERHEFGRERLQGREGEGGGRAPRASRRAPRGPAGAGARPRRSRAEAGWGKARARARPARAGAPPGSERGTADGRSAVLRRPPPSRRGARPLGRGSPRAHPRSCAPKPRTGPRTERRGEGDGWSPSSRSSGGRRGRARRVSRGREL